MSNEKDYKGTHDGQEHYKGTQDGQETREESLLGSAYTFQTGAVVTTSDATATDLADADDDDD
ncbi:hypothetical protein [Promicromonospora sp. NPDC023987]|uniref:hypothetical protein n=1 Tax=Promicromonospora sp. NPDC023987 TaxID=3155360 RepID=UPI003404A440